MNKNPGQIAIIEQIMYSLVGVTTAGVFRYHDALYPKRTGKITVKGPPPAVTLALSIPIVTYGTPITLSGAGQYDFETIVMHELGHALGLGHSADTNSVMYSTLETGTARRTLEFFTDTIRNPHTRRAYGRAVAGFAAWCDHHGLHELHGIVNYKGTT